jgi:hypothetical protein
MAFIGRPRDAGQTHNYWLAFDKPCWTEPPQGVGVQFLEDCVEKSAKSLKMRYPN